MIRLVCPNVKSDPVRVTECPLCHTKRLQIHQTITKPLKDSIVPSVTVLRMKCMYCSYTFRVYPEGVREYSGRSKRLVFMGIVLYSAGLSYTKTVAMIEAFLGKKLEDAVTVWRDIQSLGEKLRRRHFRVFRNGETVVAGIDGGYFKVMGKELCILFGVDANDSSTILFDVKQEEKKEEIHEFVKELYKEEIEKRNLPHQVCLAHMKKNFKRQIRKLPDTVPKPFIEKLTSLVDNPTPEGILVLEEYVQNPYLYTGEEEMTKTRELFAALYRKWKHYTEYCHDPTIPRTNNHTERAIGRSKFRARTTKGLKTIEGLLNFIAITQIWGEHKFNLLTKFC